MAKYAVWGGTRNIYPIMLPSVKSVLDNSDVDKCFLLIEDDVFPKYLPNCVETINVSDQEFFNKDGPNYSCSWSYMVLLRAAYCHIFKDLDLILALDVDTFARRDISQIWTFDMEDMYWAGVKEPLKSGKFPYYNIGVSLHNLKKLRDGKADHLIKLLNVSPFGFPEQDVFNIYCQEHIRELPSYYNISICTEQNQECYIMHYAAQEASQWTKSSDYMHYKSIPWSKVLHGRK